MRKAEELSITIAPAARAAGANSRLRVAPALKKAMSTPLKRIRFQLLDRVRLALELERLAGRAGRGEQLEGGDGEVPSLEDAEDFDPTAPVAPTMAMFRAFMVAAKYNSGASA